MTLYGLDDKAGILAAGKLSFQFDKISKSHTVTARQHGSECCQIEFASHQRKRSERLAMVSMLGGEKLPTAGRGPRKLHGSLDRFRSALT